MDIQNLMNLLNLSDKTAVVTGGAGVLCSAICRMLGSGGVRIAVLDKLDEAAYTLSAEICADGGEAIAITCDVLNRDSIEAAAQEILASFGQVDILINGAGGNKSEATTNTERTFFELPPDAMGMVVNLNLLGTMLPSQVFGKIMAQQDHGVILNISSMNALRPLTRIPAYSAAKAGVTNFTQWLAVHMAQEYSPRIRVNAIAPGFFLTEQNRFLLIDNEACSLTTRGRAIIDHTPQARFGTADDLLGIVLFLLSPASSFITGIVIPVDGGFSAYSGV